MKTLKRAISFYFLLILCGFSPLKAQNNLLASGPMNGYSQMREALVWVQTTEAVAVKMEYWDKAVPGTKHFTETVTTSKAKAYTAKLIADEIEPGITYSYTIYINDQALKLPYPTSFESQPLWQWRGDPPPFSFALGSCSYISEEAYDRPGTPYGSEYEIFGAINDQKPNMMLWLGDNVYLREADWHSRTGIMKRYSHTRAVSELQPLLAGAHHYAIWDDHDYGPNDADASYVHKETTLEAFELFWGNPTFGFKNLPGITTQFPYYDLDFFLLDNRYHRSPKDLKSEDKVVLGQDQCEWLISALKASRSSFKMVCIGGQVLSTVAEHENFARYPKEREWLLRRIDEEGIKGVIFLTGDRHFGELSRFEGKNGTIMYDVTVSPLTAKAYGESGAKENNENRVENCFAGERHFGIIEVSGKLFERQLKIKTMNKAGEIIWENTIDQKEF